jgi:hypothetical protein
MWKQRCERMMCPHERPEAHFTTHRLLLDKPLHMLETAIKTIYFLPQHNEHIACFTLRWNRCVAVAAHVLHVPSRRDPWTQHRNICWYWEHWKHARCQVEVWRGATWLIVHEQWASGGFGGGGPRAGEDQRGLNALQFRAMASSRWAASRIPPSCVACSIRSSLHGTCTATPTNHSLSISDTIWTSLAPRGLGGARVWSEAQHSALRASISSSAPWSGVDCRSERAKSHVGVGTSSVPVSISSRAPARVWNEKRQHGSILSSVPWSGVDCTRCERSRRCAEAGNASISRTLLRRTGLAGARVTESGGEGRHNAADVGGLLLGRPSLGCGSRTGGLRTFGVGAGGPSASAAMTEEELKNLKLDDGDVVADSDKVRDEPQCHRCATYFTCHTYLWPSITTPPSYSSCATGL